MWKRDIGFQGRIEYIYLLYLSESKKKVYEYIKSALKKINYKIVDKTIQDIINWSNDQVRKLVTHTYMETKFWIIN